MDQSSLLGPGSTGAGAQRDGQASGAHHPQEGSAHRWTHESLQPLAEPQPLAEQPTAEVGTLAERLPVTTAPEGPGEPVHVHPPSAGAQPIGAASGAPRLSLKERIALLTQRDRPAG